MLAQYALLAAVMLAIGVLLFLATAFFMAWVLLRPKRMSDARASLMLHRLSPADLGMEYEAVSFNVIDESTRGKMKIAAWWIPTASAQGRCAIIIHGYGDAKVGGIAWAPLLRSFGFNILAVDLRAHGESGGEFSTAGFWERYDVSQVIDRLKQDRPEQARQVLLFGVSLGAATAGAVALLRNDLWAVILEGPFSDFRQASRLQADRLGAPGPWAHSLAYRWAGWLAKADFDAVRPVDVIPSIPCPLLVIQSGDDPFLTPTDHDSIRQAVEARDASLGPSVHWQIDGVHHVLGLAADPSQYRQRIADFLSAVLQFKGGI